MLENDFFEGIECIKSFNIIESENYLNESINSGKKICWVREWPFACNSKKTFALEISQITLQIFCSNNSSK